MRAFADFLHRRARLVLALTGLLTVAAAVGGAGVVSSLSSGGASDPGAASSVAGRELAAASGVSPQPGIVVLVRVRGQVRSAHGRALVERVVRELRATRPVALVSSILDAARPATLYSRDGRETLVLAYFSAGASERVATRAAQRLARELGEVPGVTVGGDELTFSQLESTISTQLPQIELIAFSLLLALSLIAFRGVLAASLPLLVGAVAVAGSLLLMRLLANVTSLSVYSLNLVTGLGLGLALDYSLFIVFRYREELARRGHGAEALAHTLASAGRTVAFSSVTVATALLSLLVFPQPMLASMGMAAAVVTLFAAAAAVVPLGAALALLGPRINSLSPGWLQRGRRRAEGPVEGGHWYRLAMGVTRRPGWVAGGCAACMLVLGLPAAHVQLGSVDSRVLPPGSSARTVEAAVTAGFASDPADPVEVLLRAPGDAGTAVRRYGARLTRLPGAALAAPPQRIAPDLWEVELLSAHPPLSSSSQRLVGAVHALPAGPLRVALAGTAAAQFDQHLSLRSHAVLAFAILAAATLAVLFLMTGSVALAVKSLLMNLFTLACAVGLLVWVFQEGRLQGLLGYTATGSLEQTNMIILSIIVFGLSTDYGVFLLARIKEAHDKGASDAVAVATGLERSGRVVSAAALLFCAAIGSLAASDIASLKEFGVGAAVAVVVDATIVRALLVPALMALLGRLNWWAPRPMQAFAARFSGGLADAVPEPAAAAQRT